MHIYIQGSKLGLGDILTLVLSEQIQFSTKNMFFYLKYNLKVISKQSRVEDFSELSMQIIINLFFIKGTIGNSTL